MLKQTQHQLQATIHNSNILHMPLDCLTNTILEYSHMHINYFYRGQLCPDTQR